MILGASTYIRIWGLDRDPDVSSGFANGKVLFVRSACKSICKCKSSFQTDQRGFFWSSKNPWAKRNADGMYMWHFRGFLSACSCIYAMYVQSMAGEDRMQWLMFRVWKASCCNLGDRQKLWLIQTSPFLSLCEMTWSVPYFCCDPLIQWFYLTRQFLFVHSY